MILNLIFGFLALLSLALTLWQWLVARRFPLHQRISALRSSAQPSRSRPEGELPKPSARVKVGRAVPSAPRASEDVRNVGVWSPSHGALGTARPTPDPFGQRTREEALTSAAQPPVTLLKPLKGCDPATEDCLRSWLTQQYTGPVQILFGVAAADDPVCGIVRRLLQEFPAADAQLVVGTPLSGTNAKVAKLAELEPLAKHELLVISDADVRVPPDLLANIVAPLCEEAFSTPRRGSADFQSAVSPICNRQGVATSPDSGNCSRPAEYNSTILHSPLREPGRTKTLSQPLSPPLSDGPFLDRGSDEGGDEGSLPSLLHHPQQFENVRDGCATPASGAQACGLVCCFYRLANPATLATQCEAIAINADFWSQVLQSRSLKPIDFALGAVMATRRQQLQEVGGFAALVDCLADDYQLGNRLARRGHSIALSPVVVECWSAPMGWAEVWKHQLRWARTIRVCQPAPYFFSLLSNATLWPILWLILKPTAPVAACALVCLLVRIMTALDLQHRLNQNPHPGGRASSRAQTPPECGAREDACPPVPAPWRYAWLIPVKDLLQAVIWLLAFTGNRIEWRGERLRLRRDGTLMRG